MGPTAFDRYLLGGESERWDLPKKKERELERKKSKNTGNEKEKEKESADGGLRDDALPESSEQIQPADGAMEGVEEEEEEDEVTKLQRRRRRQKQHSRTSPMIWKMTRLLNWSLSEERTHYL